MVAGQHLPGVEDVGVGNESGRQMREEELAVFLPQRWTEGWMWADGFNPHLPMWNLVLLNLPQD